MSRRRLSLSLFALPISVLSVLCATVAEADYADIAREQTAYIQTYFYDADARKYHESYPLRPNGLPWATSWSNGVQWRVIVDAVRDQPATYLPILKAFGEGLQQYWDPIGIPPGFEAYCSGPGGKDKYYDDNAWFVLGFLEAYNATRDPQYLSWARQTQAFVLSGWDDKLGGGIYWSYEHKSKNTCVNAPAAVGALELAALGDPKQSEWATRIVGWVNATLEDTDGLYWDNIKLDGTVQNWKFTYNTALMIEADVLLFRTRGDRSALLQAQASADAAIAAWQDPATGAFKDRSSFSHLLCEALLQLYQTDHHIAYLDAVRRHAAFGYRYGRDPDNGGFWSDWKIGPHQPDETKSLLENASDARLYWLLSPYQDSDQLYASAIQRLSTGDVVDAQDLLEQSADSDTEAVEARYHLWRLLLRENENAAASDQEDKLVAMSSNPQLMVRLTALGWQSPSTTPIALH